MAFDPFTALAIGQGAMSLIGGITSSNAAGRQARAARKGQQQLIERTEPFRQVGVAAAGPIMQLLGIQPPQMSGGPVPGPAPASTQANLFSQSTFNQSPRAQRVIGDRATIQPAPAPPTAQQFPQIGPQQPQQPAMLEEINPLVGFLRDEGFEDIQESAAAQGMLRSGGTLQDLTRFNTQLASQVAPQLQQQRFNQLFNLLGLGSNAASLQGTSGAQAAQAAGAASAGGALGVGSALQSGISGIAGLLGAQQAGLFTPPPSTDQFLTQQFGFDFQGDPFGSF